jgi:molecular chaperone DnaK (HSP70)
MANNNHSIITIGTVVPGQDTGRGWRRHQPRLSMSGLSLNPTSQLVIGIDFGTTFTGVAFAHSSIGIENARSNSASQSELDAVIEKITVIKSWPNPNRQYDEKTPSIIAYKDGRPVAWGGLMNRTHKTRVHCFKLGLQEGVGQHYQNSNASSLLGGFLNDCNWRHPDLPSKTAVDYCADYLTLVGEYVMNKVLPDHFGEEFLRNQQISFAITVPAIWSDKAKDATREAAERAGIPNRRLTLITEPEAAAQYCATICNEAGLTTGNHFLICDAGGGTVVSPIGKS